MTEKHDNDIVLAAPVRTPIGKFSGILSPLSAADLGTAAAAACLARAGCDPKKVDQVIFGHGRQAGGGPNTARQIAWRAGVPVDRPAFTVNQACASGLQSILSAARTILTGEAEVVLAGGTESMSNTPYFLLQARTGYRLGHGEIVDGMYRDGFNDPLSGLVMGETAEELAVESGIDRAASDAWAVGSQNRCERARAAGRFEARFDSEITPVKVPGKKGDLEVTKDEHPRDGVTLPSLTRLAPVFREGGTVTAGNASGITDGAASILVASRRAARELGLPVAARLLGWQVVGVEPRIMGIGPVPAVQKLLAKTGHALSDIEEMELNEAFASQVLACLKGLGLPETIETVNPDGGAIALGHPIGATGTRILVTLLHGMAARDRELGIATLCVSGGMGVAALVRREAA
jgi:acetyl-CoA C-acetyltransferase